MEDLYPWSSLRTVERVIAEYGEDELRAWLRVHWNDEFLGADEAVIRRLLPYVDLTGIGGRAKLVLYCVDKDWVDVLDRDDVEACGFLAPFWRAAFAHAQEAGSAQCIAWLLDRKGPVLGSRKGSGLEL